MKRRVWFAAVLAALCSVIVAAAQEAKFTSKDLIGRWVSASVENYGQFYGKREFVLTERAWAISFNAFGDDKASVPLWTLRVEGTYVLGQAHPKVAGARYADFAGSAKYITAYTDEFLKTFSNGASWKKNTEYEFSRTGAGFFPSVEAGPVEYDLVKLEGNTLFLGDRSVDLNKERAQKASAYALVRR